MFMLLGLRTRRTNTDKEGREGARVPGCTLGNASRRVFFRERADQITNLALCCAMNTDIESTDMRQPGKTPA
jgi:hypothetical protein